VEKNLAFKEHLYLGQLKTVDQQTLSRRSVLEKKIFSPKGKKTARFSAIGSTPITSPKMTLQLPSIKKRLEIVEN
jgi:hypothetical protein